MRSPSRIAILLPLLLLCSTEAFAAGLEPPHDGSEAIGCVSCHQMTSSYPKLLPPLGHTPTNIDDTLANNVCWSCHNDTIAPFRVTHSSLTTSSKYGNWTVECWVCHSEHRQEQHIYYGSTYGKFVRRAVNLEHIAGPAKTGLKPVKLLGPTGPNSFADGEGSVDGVCEVCHTATTAWHNDGTLAGTKAHTGLKGSNCTACHPHDQGFKPVYDCLDCHQNAINDRAAVGQLFGGNSHHIQGVAATGDKC